jgi:hypothetical protein
MAPARILLVAVLLAGCGSPSVKEFSSRPPVLTVEWRGDQKLGVRCIVDHLSELKWKSEVLESGATAQVVWYGPSTFGIPKRIAVFEVTGATAAKAGQIVLHAAGDLDEPDRVRRSWFGKIESCSP